MISIVLSALAATMVAEAPPPKDQAVVIVAVGAPGTPEYEKQFAETASLWERHCQKADARCIRIGGDKAESTTPDRDKLKETIEREGAAATQPMWVVLIGHGTFDGRTARFNLAGPDASAEELSKWLAPCKQPVAVVLGFSCSGAFLRPLAAQNRFVVSATRSGNEHNFSRFGEFFAQAIGEPLADYDQDGEVSLLEAFLYASRSVADFYVREGRLATEHALLDDNGDGLGTPADRFIGLRPAAIEGDNRPVDGRSSHQRRLIVSPRERAVPLALRQKRDEIEAEFEALFASKSSLDPDDYRRQVEVVLLKLARLYEEFDKVQSP